MAAAGSGKNIEEYLPIVKQQGLNTAKAVDFSNASSVALPGTSVGIGAVNVISATATALTVAGAGTNYGLQVDESTASAVTGIKVKPAAAAGGVAVSVISSGTNESATIDAKGNGTITLGSVSTGGIVIGGASGSATPLTITQAVGTTGSPVALTLTGAAHTTLTASTEVNDVNLNLARIVQFATGALTTQRAVFLQAPTYAFVAASTITNAATLAISGAPTAGTNATITNNWALWVAAGSNFFQSTTPSALVVGPSAAGANPSFNVDASTASAATGLNIKSAAATAGLAVSVISSGAAESLTVDAKGTGTISLGTTSTGLVIASRGAQKALVIGNALGTSSAQSITITAAQLLGGVFEHTVTTGAATDTTDTGTAISSAIPGVAVGDTFTFVLVNTSASAFAITVAAGVGVTLKGSAATIPQNKTGYLLFRNTGANTWTAYLTVSA